GVSGVGVGVSGVGVGVSGVGVADSGVAVGGAAKQPFTWFCCAAAISAPVTVPEPSASHALQTEMSMLPAAISSQVATSAEVTSLFPSQSPTQGGAGVGVGVVGPPAHSLSSKFCCTSASSSALTT